MLKGRDLEAFCCGSGMHMASICSIVMARCPNCGSEVWVLQTIGKEVEHGNKVSVNEVGSVVYAMSYAQQGMVRCCLHVKDTYSFRGAEEYSVPVHICI